MISTARKMSINPRDTKRTSRHISIEVGGILLPLHLVMKEIIGIRRRRDTNMIGKGSNVYKRHYMQHEKCLILVWLGGVSECY